MRLRSRPTNAAPARARRAPFYALLAANAVSMNGNALAQLAIPWFVLETTGSAARAGLAAACGLLPSIPAAFFGGVLVDRLGHKRASVGADLASALAVALIPALHARGLLTFGLLLALVFLGALLDAPGATARASLLPDLAGLARLRLERANAVHEVIESGAQSTGPLLGGLAIAWLGPAAVLWADAATFAVSALLVAAAVPAWRGAARPSAAGPRRAELLAGLRFVLGDRPLRSIFVSAAALNFLISPTLAVVLPYHMKTAYDDAAGLGFAIAAFGGGSVVGAAVFGAVGGRLPRRGLFVVGVCAIGAAIATLATLPPAPVMIGAMLLGGIVSGPNGPLVATVLQERTPAALRGRVFGATTAVGFAAAPLGVLLAGSLLETVGVQATLVSIAAVFLAVTLLLARDAGLREMAARL